MARRTRRGALAFAYLCLLLCLTPSWATDIPPTITYLSKGFPYAKNGVSVFSNGTWRGAIFTPAGASAETNTQASTLRTYLMKIGGSIDIVTYSAGSHALSPGFRVGLYSEWAPVSPDDYLRNHTNDYIIISRSGSVRINGKTHDGLRQGIWRTLEMMGYRQFFPSATWEYVPIPTNFVMNVGALENQNLSRNELIGGSSLDLPENTVLRDEWKMKNRLDMGQPIQDNQMWYKIVQDEDYAPEFAQPSTYVSASGNKLCVLEPRVQDIVFEYLGKEIEKFPERFAYSVSAGDSVDGWTTSCSAAELALTPSQRQIILANEMQRRMNTALPTSKYYGKHVAFLGYGMMSPDPAPYPTVPEPGMAVTIATAYIIGSLTPQAVARHYVARFPVGGGSGTTPQGHIGMYGYTGVQYGGHSLPTQGQMARQTLWDDLFHEIYSIINESPAGSRRYITGEAGTSWGAFGVGYYVLAKLLTPPYTMHTNPTNAIATIYADFIAKAFGATAVGPMTEYFNLVTGADGSGKFVSTDLIHKMYAFLKTARDVAVDTHQEKTRINELILYTRAVELWFQAEQTEKGTAARGAALYALGQHLYRIRHTFMFDFYYAWSDPTLPDMSEELQARCPAFGQGTLNGNTVVNHAHACVPAWSSAPFSTAEVDAIIANGLATNALFPFTPISYGLDDLDITTAFDADTRGRVGEGGEDALLAVEKNHEWIFKSSATQTAFTLRFKATHGAGDASLNARAELYHTNVGAGLEVFLDGVSVASDGIEVRHQFAVMPNTTYKLRIINESAQVTPWLGWDRLQHRVVHVPREGERWHLKASYKFFYVPKSATTIAFYFGMKDSVLYKPDGTEYFRSREDAEKYHAVNVDPVDRGQVWKMYCRGTTATKNGCYLFNVPPQLARSPRELLIQKSVIMQDNLSQ